MQIPISMRLAVRQWRARPLRPVLCSLAIAAAVTLIVCVGAAMDSLQYSVQHAIGQVLGVAEVHVRPAQRETDARVGQALLEKLRGLPEVEMADGRLLGQAVLTKGEDRLWYDVVGIDEPTDEKLRPKSFVAGRTIAAGAAGEGEILVDSSVADKMKLKVGDEISYTIKEKPARMVKIVGITRRPTIEFITKATVFVPLMVLERDLAILPPEFNGIDVKLRESAGVEDYDQYAKELGERLGKGIEVTPGTSSKAQMADVTKTLRLFLVLLSTLSAFCASLIIGTTLSVGVQERVRQFGQLRCIGASRGQLALFLLGDAAVMLAIGEIVGSVMGVALSKGLIAWFPQFFEEYQLSAGSLAIALLCGGVATMLGAMIPMWQVTRVPPMAAVTATARKVKASRVWLAGGIGVACMGLQVLLWNLPVSRDVRVFGYMFAGVPLIFAGWCLVAPLAVVVCERLGAAVLGVIFRVKSGLLRSAWSRTPWRAGAMIAALMIGVTLFTAVRARGQSLLTSWATPKIPDLVVKSILGGFSEKRVERLRKEHPELKDMAPFEYFGVKMKGDVTKLGKILNEEETTFISVDPKQFAGLVTMEYVQGDAKTALAQLQQGGYVYVSKEFYNVRKLGVGDSVALKAADGSMVDFKIAAVVSSTGMEMVKNYFDLRASFGEKAVSSLLGNLGDGKKYFKMGEPSLMLINLDHAKLGDDAAAMEKMTQLRKTLEGEGLQSLSSVELKATLTRVIVRIMEGLSVIGFGALCVASLGVANMVIASVHARRFEFGVLRAIGAGRWQLVRLVLAEVSLIGIIAGVLGAGTGLTFAFMATQMDAVVIGFKTSFLDPQVGQALREGVVLVCEAVALTTLLAWVAALAPAIRGAVTAQRTLLAAGRG